MLNYVIGDATYPIGDGPKVIAHCVNDLKPGKWGSGFVLAINKRWMKPREEYIKWSSGRLAGTRFDLGCVQFVQVEDDLWVANVVGQHQTIRENPSPIRYEALRKGLAGVGEFCISRGASYHSCRLGSGLARGSWPLIEQIIQEEIVNRGVSAIVYDLG
jgi:hypothetical protein